MKHILFVDDEPRILQGLQRLLRPQRNEWEMSFANGADEAVAELEAGHFDVVVTDMRMPGRDGAELLAEVRQRWPHVTRIILSGHTEQEAAMRAVPVAHQFLTKPCSAEQFKAVIERACALAERVRDPRLQAIVGSVDTLPSLPMAYVAITEAMADPDVAIPDVTAAVEKDPAMCAKILQLVNSSFFGLPRHMTNLQQAVSYLGLSTLRSLVLSVTVFRSFENVPSGLSLEALQAHGAAVAAAASRVAERKTEADDAFAAGILVDVGQLLLAERAGDEYQAVVAERPAGVPLHEAELDRLGVTHADVGAYLLGLWGLPNSMVEAVAHHHDATILGSASTTVADCVYIGHVLAQGDPATADPMDRPDLTLDPEYLNRIGAAGRAMQPTT